MKRKNVTGGNIRRLRAEAGLTQEELALRSGLSQGYINQIESGKRKFTQKSLEKISDALSIPIIELFREEEPFVVKEGEVKYGRKQPVNEFIALLKELPPHIAGHYLTLLKMEVELWKEKGQTRDP